MIDFNQEYRIRKAAGTFYGKSQNRKKYRSGNTYYTPIWQENVL